MIKEPDLHSRDYHSMMEYYNHIAKYTDEYWQKEKYTHKVDNLFYERGCLDRLSSQNVSGNVLDIGCGTGHWLEQYYTGCASVHLLDQSEEMLRICQSKIKGLGATKFESSLIRHDFFKWETSIRFSSIIMCYFLCHFPRLDQNWILSKAHNLLEKGGNLFLVCSLKHEGLSDIELETGIQKRNIKNEGIFNIYKEYYNVNELLELIQGAGFRIESKTSFWGEYFAGVNCIKDE